MEKVKKKAFKNWEDLNQDKKALILFLILLLFVVLGLAIGYVIGFKVAGAACLERFEGCIFL